MKRGRSNGSSVAEFLCFYVCCFFEFGGLIYCAKQGEWRHLHIGEQECYACTEISSAISRHDINLIESRQYFQSTCKEKLGGGFSHFLFSPLLQRIPILTSIFFNWVLQPSSSKRSVNDMILAPFFSGRNYINSPELSH